MLQERHLDWGRKSTKIIFYFIPPIWMSNISFSSELKLCYRGNSPIPSLNYGLRPFVVNLNSQLLQAIEALDSELLEKLLSDGTVRPTDYILTPFSREALPLDEVRLQGRAGHFRD